MPIDGWEDAPEGATGIVRGIEWESQFGDLDVFRRYVGKYRVVLPAVTMQKVVNVLDGNGDAGFGCQRQSKTGMPVPSTH